MIRYETTGRRADGSTFPAEIAESPFEFDGLPSRLVVISDISWRHDADAIRDRFIGVLSHELRTPITSIFGGTQVLLSRGRRLDEDTRDALLADVAAEAERLQRMIENLLILARVERGADVSEVVPVLLHRVVPEVVAREQANWPAMTLETDIERGLPVVAGDEASVALVLRNLDLQRRQVRRRQMRTCASRSDGNRPATWPSVSPTTDRASTPTNRRPCSPCTSGRRRVCRRPARASACSSAATSSPRWAARCGRSGGRRAAPSSGSPCQPGPRRAR